MLCISRRLLLKTYGLDEDFINSMDSACMNLFKKNKTKQDLNSLKSFNPNFFAIPQPATIMQMLFLLVKQAN